MTKETIETTVEVLGKTYNLRCPKEEVGALERAAQFLEDQMRVMRESAHLLSSDKIIITTALNIAHQLIVLEHKTIQEAQAFQERLSELQAKIDNVLSQSMESEPVQQN